MTLTVWGNSESVFCYLLAMFKLKQLAPNQRNSYKDTWMNLHATSVLLFLVELRLIRLRSDLRQT